MSQHVLTPVPLTRERFAPFGDVISTSGCNAARMNAARFDRFNALSFVEVDSEGSAAIGIVRSREATALPYHFDTVERHPLGSQAFIPLSQFSFIVVVGPAGESIDPGDLRAFATDGKQGVNYRRGTWHMPLIATERAQSFLVVDRAPMDGNCEEHVFDQSVILSAPR